MNARGPVIELVTDAGSREIAVLIFRSVVDEDQGASAAVTDVSARRVYGIAVRILRSPTQAEQVALDADLEVWRATTGFDADRTSAMAWVMALDHRRAVDRSRSGDDATHLPCPGPIGPLGRRAARNARRLDQATWSEAHQVREALARLNPEQCEALELVYYDGSGPAQTDDLPILVDRALPRTPLEDGAMAPEVPGRGPSPAASRGESA